MKPILETQRLILRASVVEDAPDLFEMDADPEVQRYTGDIIPASVTDTIYRIRNYPDYEKYGYGRWTTVLKETGEIIGWCGLKCLDDIDETDLGYRWKPKHWNKGYATEASLACLQYGFDELKLPQIIAQVLKENGASIRVLEKIGMTYWKELHTEDNPGLFYRITEAEYRQH